MLSTFITDLGARHANYKMNGRDDFAIGGHCFIFTVKVVLGDKFTPEVEEAFSRMCIIERLIINYIIKCNIHFFFFLMIQKMLTLQTSCRPLSKKNNSKDK